MPELALRDTKTVWITLALAVGAVLTAWPEPVGPGWHDVSLVAGIVGVLTSIPWWRSAAAEQRANNKPGFTGGLAMAGAGAFIAVVVVHLANFALPPGGPQEAIVSVTDKYVSRGRRGLKRHMVITTSPFIGEPIEGHSVGGFGGTAGNYYDYKVGGCMALSWRQGWFGWAVITRRAPVPCRLPAPGFGTAWSFAMARMAGVVARATLPAKGRLLLVEVASDHRGAITDVVTRQPSGDAALDAAVIAALSGIPYTLPPDTRRTLPLRLIPPQ